MLLVPPVAIAVAPVPVAVAVQLLQLVASAVLPAPRAIARERWPVVVVASASPTSARCTPLTETLTFPPPPEVCDDVVADVVDESVDVEEFEFAGLAAATSAVATTAAPMPKKTANAPTRPIYLEYPIIVPFP